MTTIEMTSMQRVLATLGHREPDRVPFFLLLTMHGARELGVPLREYFARPEWVAEGQVRLQARYRHDCYYAFHYAPIEVEAWGGEIVVSDEGPVNSGVPFLRHPDDIERLQPPDVQGSPCLRRVLTTIELLKQRAAGNIPIIGVVMSPFSLPVMQLGFERYLDLILERPALFERLMRVNEEFCVAWANAQLAAGATAICYFDPVSSTTIVSPTMYQDTGWAVAKRTLARVQGPTATHFASGRCLGILDDVMGTGTAVVGVSAEENLAELKGVARGRVSLLGNLNGIALRTWTPDDVEREVKAAIAAGAPGGGFILADNHGEIPWQVPEVTLDAVSEAVHRWGRYPLSWVGG